MTANAIGFRGDAAISLKDATDVMGHIHERDELRGEAIPYIDWTTSVRIHVTWCSSCAAELKDIHGLRDDEHRTL